MTVADRGTRSTRPLLRRAARTREREQIDLATCVGDRKTRIERGDEGRRGNLAAEMPCPHLIERRYIPDVGKIYLRFHSARKRGPGARERRHQLVADDVIDLELYAIALPEMPVRYLRFGGDAAQIARFPRRHESSDENVVAGGSNRGKGRGRGDVQPRRIHRRDRTAALALNGYHFHRHARAAEKQFRFEDRCARGDIVAAMLAPRLMEE